MGKSSYDVFVTLEPLHDNRQKLMGTYEAYSANKAIEKAIDDHDDLLNDVVFWMSLNDNTDAEWIIDRLQFLAYPHSYRTVASF